MRFIAIFPFLCSVGAFILAMLCLFAGSKPNFMEEYAIVTLNTSTLGHVLIPTPTSSSSPAPSATSITSWLTGTFKNLTSSIENEIVSDLESIEGNVADLLASKLGISQWYSLHMMDLCEGVFTPNATKAGAWYNATKCTNRTAAFKFNPSAVINSELSIAGLHLNLSTIQWPDSIQQDINLLNTAFAATSILYILGIAFAGLALFSALLTFFLSTPSRLLPFANFFLTFISFICLTIASAIITILMTKLADIVNQQGNEIGVFAYKGGRFLALTWSAVTLMGVASVAWVVDCCLGRRRRRTSSGLREDVMLEKEHERVVERPRGWRSRF